MTVPPPQFIIPGRRVRKRTADNAHDPAALPPKKVAILPNCFYCGMPAAVVERDHFPIPERHGGTETVTACINCHALKDRNSLESWPREAGDAAMAELRSQDHGLPAIMFINMWGQWSDEPHALPLNWKHLTPLARVLWGRLLALRLDLIADPGRPGSDYGRRLLGVD